MGKYCIHAKAMIVLLFSIIVVGVFPSLRTTATEIKIKEYCEVTVQGEKNIL